ncbi:MAG: hypothetical protein M3256_26910, partial [Actinomycetota bacterium]|nr:hypothetical protein [Actinomycetota bacterium]
GTVGTSLALTGFPTFGFVLLGLMLILLGAVLVRAGAMRHINGPRSRSVSTSHSSETAGSS